MELKTELRKKFKDERDAFFASTDTQSLRVKVLQNLNSLLSRVASRRETWASYKPIQSEADVSNIQTTQDISWCYPVIHGQVLEFYKPNGKWQTNHFAIAEPDTRSSQKISVNKIRGVLIPGLAFDRQGHRLGWGKAFYDRTLKNFSGLKVGIAYSVQITSLLPFDDHDISMDYVVTEKEVLKTEKKEVS